MTDRIPLRDLTLEDPAMPASTPAELPPLRPDIAAQFQPADPGRPEPHFRDLDADTYPPDYPLSACQPGDPDRDQAPADRIAAILTTQWGPCDHDTCQADRAGTGEECTAIRGTVTDVLHAAAEAGYVVTAAAELAEVRTILRDLTDPDPCHYDHHGYCQAHDLTRARVNAALAPLRLRGGPQLAVLHLPTRRRPGPGRLGRRDGDPLMRDPIRDDYWTTLGNQVSAAYTRLSHNPDHNPTTLWGDALRAVLHDTPAQIQSETTYAIAMAAEQRNRADKADRDATQLRELLDITAVHRTDAVIRLINATRRSGGKHDDECWTRHAWCLAERIRDTITGSPQ